MINKTTLSWSLRILIFGLFTLSAVAKMFPIWPFERQLIDLGFADWCSAPYLARIIIGIELSLGIAILQNNFIKRLVIPATALLLIVFCAHLTREMVLHGAMNGNCGCFGQMIPMTPLEAFIKNILTLGLLFWLYRITEEKPTKHRFSILLLIWSSSSLLMFSVFPFAPCKGSENTTATDAEAIPWEEDSTSTTAVTPTPITDAGQATATAPVQEVGPYPAESKFSKLNVFGNKRVKINEGKRIVCFFVPGCDHCREAAKGLTELSKDPNFPPVYVYFMDEETFLIEDFFKYAGKKYPYQILDVPSFWQLMGTQNETPGVVYLWNGNIRKEFYGSDGFNKEALKAACNQAP